jgi:hypothetical protein
VEAEEFAGFGGGDAGVGGEAVEVVEAVARGPRGEGGLAQPGETFLEVVEDDSGAGIAGRNGTAGAGVAAFEMNLADGEADGIAFVFGEELVFPEGGDTVNFEGGAETLADVVDGKTGKPLNDGLEGGGGDDGGAVGDGVVGEATWRIADDDALLEEDAEPFSGVLVGVGEGESARRDFAGVGGYGEGDGGEVGGVQGADVVDEGSALAVDPFAVDGVEGPGTVEGESAGGGDAGLGDGYGIEGFDGVETDAGEGGSRERRGHQGSLTREEKFCELGDISATIN